MGYDCSCDYDPVSFYVESDVKKSRKPHRCVECRGPIAVGEAYRRRRYGFEGDVYNEAICPRCCELLRWAQISVPCFCYGFGNLLDDVRSMVEQVSPDVRGFVFEWGRRIVKLKRHATGQHWPIKAEREDHERKMRERRTAANQPHVH